MDERVDVKPSETQVARPDMSTGKALTTPPTNAAPTLPPQVGVIMNPRPRRSLRRVLGPLALLAAIGYGGVKGYDWFVTGRFIVSTEDAYIRADTSTIAAKVAGYLTLVPVAENAAVKKGDLLAQIDDGDYTLAVRAAQDRIASQDATLVRLGEQAKAQGSVIDQAQAMLASARADAGRSAAEFDRATKLVASQYGTPQRLEQAQADRDRTAAVVLSAQAAIANAQAGLAVLKAQLAEARGARAELVTAKAKVDRDLAFTQVKAPFDGIVGNKAAQPGQYVQPGTRLLALVPLDSAYIEANFKETQLAAMKPGQKVSFFVDAYPGRELFGAVQSLAPASGAQFSMLPPENATGNFTKIVQRLPVRIALPPELLRENVMRPGLSVAVDVHTRDEREAPPTLMGALGLTRTR